VTDSVLSVVDYTLQTLHVIDITV